MTQEQVLELCRETGAYLRGHFRLTSGLHSPEYLQCALLLADPRIAERLGIELAERLHPLLAGDANVDFVASPALGGLIIGHEVARALRSRFLFVERNSEARMTLRRGFGVEPGARGVVIEDVITTGGSTAETVAVMKAAGGNVVAAGSIMDRSGGKADTGTPRVALATLNVEAYPPDSCPLCAQGIPVVKPGSRK